MRVSLKLQQGEGEEVEKEPKSSTKKHALLLSTKLPISIFNNPFLSALSLSSLSPSSPTLSLQTHSLNSPSFKLSYTPSSPLTLSLSTGVSLSASPFHSPLTFSAHFSLYPFNPSPTFSLLIKPDFGDFSLRKSIFSSPGNPNSLPSRPGSPFNFFDPVSPLGSPKDSIFVPTREKPAVSVWARTVLPVTKNVLLRFRWGVGFPGDFRKGFPFLSLDKVGIERVEEGREQEERQTGFEALRGMCASVGREVEDLRRENREMRWCLDEMMRKAGSGEIEGWNKVKNIGVCKEMKSEPNGDNKEMKRSTNGANELESEFQRAIMAASASR